MTEILTSPNYPRAPITEAVIQFRVSADVESRLQDKVVQKLKKNFPHSQPMHEFQIMLNPTGNQVSVSQNTQGFRLANDDQTEVVMVGARGITAARLAPYPGWQALRRVAELGWAAWKSSTPGNTVETLGVRFINRIDIPNEGNAPVILETYLNFHPSVTTVAQAPLLGFTLQVVVPTFNPLWIATITSALAVPPPILNCASIFLDINIVRTQDILLNDDLLWPIVDEARAIKNDLFERCVTPATRKLFE